MSYINFSFKDLVYTDEIFTGIFEAPDYDVYCRFEHNRQTKHTDLWDNNKPVDTILPLPIHWLEYQLEKNGKLEKNIHKVSF